MSKRIYWKKGMRLTDEVLSMSDNCTSDLIGKSMLLSAGGNYGLFPAPHPFNVNLNINKNIIDVVSLNCMGITRDGSFIDVEYDTNYTSSFDTRTIIPSSKEDMVFILCISPTSEWRDTNDGMCEPVYSFALIEEFSPVPAKSLPIARIVYDENCWRMDDINFVPPCLFISSSEKYEELASNFTRCLKTINALLPAKFITEKKNALTVFWPAVQNLLITMDKESSMMSPMSLFANVQKLVASFVCACSIDDYINLGYPEIFLNYINYPYNYQDAYAKIKEGIELCFSITEKIENFESQVPEETPKVIESPTISNNQLIQNIEYGEVTIDVKNNEPGSTVYYTIDGTNPTSSSYSGTKITLDSGFTNHWHKEPPKFFDINLVSIKNGKRSAVSSYKIKITKGKKFGGKEI